MSGAGRVNMYNLCSYVNLPFAFNKYLDTRYSENAQTPKCPSVSKLVSAKIQDVSRA